VEQRDALAAHGKGAAVAQLHQALDGLVAGPAEVVVLDAGPAGDRRRGWSAMASRWFESVRGSAAAKKRLPKWCTAR